MRHRIFEDGGEDDLVFLMDWGNRWTHENVSWLIGRLTDAGFRVHAFELPTAIEDFKADWLEPVAEYVVDLDGYQLLGHGAGALVGQALDGAENHVYLSPLWGVSEAYPDLLLEAIAAVPATLPFVPVGEPDRETVGSRATDHQLATTPRWISPTLVREIRRAQQELLTIDHDAVVFCSLRDRRISHEAIGKRVPAAHVVCYDGGHELFSSQARDRYVGTVIDALREGAAAVEDRPTVPTTEPSDAATAAPESADAE
ncbi:alpha/beta hydrolase [Halobacteria archaeon AArc-dxtr1]|nr:alpha/beta hydrolase [Halobacteria archaeon AArc-dxtr1]